MITISRQGERLGVTTFLFPGGEVGVKLDVNNHRYLSTTGPHKVVARIHSSADLMELVMVTDALRRLDDSPIEVALPYVPYGRQDRACVAGEPSSLIAFARIINSLGFRKVTTFDPHSDVTGAVLEDVEIIDQVKIFGKFDALTKLVISTGAAFVSPDAGANKKTAALAKYFSHSSFVRADKNRNLHTGEIVETIVHGTVPPAVIIADDICDGGRTFIELTKALRLKGAKKVYLYVTHGIFSKSTTPLSIVIDQIFTTNAFYDVWPGNAGPEPVTLNLDNAFDL